MPRRGRDFNPRSPHGERLSFAARIVSISKFQPTLPARGATDAVTVILSVDADFNPRSPHGERQRCWRCSAQALAFQPTLPARGATKKPAAAKKSAKQISTHAPRTGSDISPASRRSDLCAFQPTPPARGATSWQTCRRGRLRNFNPRPPHGERRFLGALHRGVEMISTHAPRTGSDRCPSTSPPERCNFNPRPPHGERPKSSCDASFCSAISTHAPARGATGQNDRAAQHQQISTHAPRTGSD